MVLNPLNQILNSYHENKLSHAFLIETNDQEQCLKDLKLVISEINCENEYRNDCKLCNLCHMIETEQLPSLRIIKPDGQNIKKDQILELKQYFSTKPLFSKYNVYVILNAEKLNASSANTLLKFLEEPEEGILGFFITNNKENIIETIRSRCQIILNSYKNLKEDDQILTICINYLKLVHESSDLSVFINKDFFEEKRYSREDYQKLFQSMINIYYNYYQVSLGIKKKEENSNLDFLLKYDANFFLRQLMLIKNLEEEMSYNVNINLLLDRFVLETRTNL